MKTLRRLLLIFGLMLISNFSLAQSNTDVDEDYKKFISTFSQIIYYPVELMRNSTPIVCLIKVQVDDVKKVTDLQLSDSADSLMQTEFKQLKHSLNTKMLETYLKKAYNSSTCTTYIIPLSYSKHQGTTTLQTIKITTLYNYAKFKGISLNQNINFLDPIYLEFGVQN